MKDKNLFHTLALLFVLIAVALLVKDKLFFQVIQRVEKAKVFQDRELPIITYHYVEIVTDDKDFIRKDLSVAPQFFEKNIVDAKSKGYEFVFVKELPEIISGDIKIEKPLAFTFDDGYRDFYTDVFPIIKKYNIKVTVYVVPHFVGLNKNYMSLAQLKEVLASGLVELGSHSIKHHDLTRMSVSEARQEIFESKAWFVNNLNVISESFAYPYGFYNDELASLVKEAGYECAVTVDKGTTQGSANMFNLSRISSGSIYSVL